VKIAPPDDTLTKPDSSAAPRWLAVVALIAAMTLMRLIYASLLDLRTDEAYYWTWSKESALSFLDHPPMIAWFIRFGTAIFGDTNLGVRFAGILAMLATQLLLADIVRRVTHDFRAIVLALLMPEAALYYGLLMAKVAPDTAMIPFAVAMLWALVRLHESGDARWWLAAGLFAGLALLSKFTAVMLMPAVLAFALVPEWCRRWLLSPYPYLAALVAIVVFSPVLIWNYQHDWASFRFQVVRAVATHELSLRTVGEFIGLQFGLVGFVLLPAVLSGVTLTAWRGYTRREPVAILLSTAVIVPFGYFFWKSLTLRVGDTWPMFLWPAGFAAAAINIAMLPREGWPEWMIQSTMRWARVAVISGIAFVVGVFFYYVAAPWNLIGRTDPVGGEAGYEQLAIRAREQLQETGANWIATTDYRTYAMLRWYFNGRVPVIQINERGRFQGFGDPGMDLIRGHVGLYVGREPDNALPLWNTTTAVRQPLERVKRSWRGTVMDTYALEKLTGWTPELSPPPDSPLFRWRVLALSFSPQAGRGGV
jgi:4-amino-4-deoxy-L-arabinose transferase-like glycosyltransferase